MKYLINLFPEREKNASEKIIYFGFHYLRYILVITQFVAICVFFFRFKVDQEIVDLKDKLYQKQSIVTATSELVGQVGEIDAKIQKVQSILDEQELFKSKYTYVMGLFNSSIAVTTLTISADAIDINGSAITVQPIKILYDKLLTEKKFKVVDLSNVEKGNDQFSFTLHLAEFSI